LALPKHSGRRHIDDAHPISGGPSTLAMVWLLPTPWSAASADEPSKALSSLAGLTPRLGDVPSRGTSPLSDTGSPRSEISYASSSATPKRATERASSSATPPALAGSVHDWLERVKKGYGRFTVAFEALGVEDTNDVKNIDRTILEHVETLLRDGCAAKSMHLKNIRVALLDIGCNLRTSSEEVAAAEGQVPFLALADAKGRLPTAAATSSSAKHAAAPSPAAARRPLGLAASVSSQQQQPPACGADAVPVGSSTPLRTPPHTPPRKRTKAAGGADTSSACSGGGGGDADGTGGASGGGDRGAPASPPKAAYYATNHPNAASASHSISA